MTDIVYEGLTVSVRKRDDQGSYEFGVVLDGAFVVFSARKTGGIDDDIKRAADEAEQAKASKSSRSKPAG